VTIGDTVAEMEAKALIETLADRLVKEKI